MDPWGIGALAFLLWCLLSFPAGMLLGRCLRYGRTGPPPLTWLPGQRPCEPPRSDLRGRPRPGAVPAGSGMRRTATASALVAGVTVVTMSAAAAVQSALPTTASPAVSRVLDILTPFRGDGRQPTASSEASPGHERAAGATAAVPAQTAVEGSTGSSGSSVSARHGSAPGNGVWRSGAATVAHVPTVLLPDVSPEHLSASAADRGSGRERLRGAVESTAERGSDLARSPGPAAEAPGRSAEAPGRSAEAPGRSAAGASAAPGGAAADGTPGDGGGAGTGSSPDDGPDAADAAGPGNGGGPGNRPGPGAGDGSGNGGGPGNGAGPGNGGGSGNRGGGPGDGAAAVGTPTSSPPGPAAADAVPPTRTPARPSASPPSAAKPAPPQRARPAHTGAPPALGRPDDVGRPETPGRPSEAGKPEHAGTPKKHRRGTASETAPSGATEVPGADAVDEVAEVDGDG